jgi:hypothetical protein
MAPQLTPHLLMQRFAASGASGVMWMVEHDDGAGPAGAVCVFMEAETGAGEEALDVLARYGDIEACISHPEWTAHTDLGEMLQVSVYASSSLLHWHSFEHAGQTIYIVLATGSSAVEQMGSFLDSLVESE